MGSVYLLRASGYGLWFRVRARVSVGFRARVSGLDARAGHQRGERVVRDLRSSARHVCEESALPGVGVADETDLVGVRVGVGVWVGVRVGVRVRVGVGVRVGLRARVRARVRLRLRVRVRVRLRCRV